MGLMGCIAGASLQRCGAKELPRNLRGGARRSLTSARRLANTANREDEIMDSFRELDVERRGGLSFGFPVPKRNPIISSSRLAVFADLPLRSSRSGLLLPSAGSVEASAAPWPFELLSSNEARLNRIPPSP